MQRKHSTRSNTYLGERLIRIKIEGTFFNIVKIHKPKANILFMAKIIKTFPLR